MVHYIVFHSTTFSSHLHAYISHNNSLISRSSSPPTVACKTPGKERLGKRLDRYHANVMLVFVKQYITWVYVVHCTYPVSLL